MDGILVVDKPAGITSHDVVARVRRILAERRIGHTGTLDPFATGVLVLLVGRATRLAQFVSKTNKEYDATIRLGYATDTGDIDGVPLHPEASEDNRSWSAEEIDNAIKQLTGEIQQVPPMYSAKKQGGKKLYELARRGQEVDRQPVTVRIFAFERSGNQLPLRNEDGTADLNVRVECSAGTYIRVLAEDLGRLLGVRAHLAALRRTRVGDFHVRDAITLENLDRLADGPVGEVLKPPQLALSGMPFLHLSEAETEKVRNGVALSVLMSSWHDGENIGLSDEEGKLIGVGQYDPAKHLVHPRVVLSAEKSC